MIYPVDSAMQRLNNQGQDFKAILEWHLQPVCIAVLHFTEIICCNTEITNMISVFDNKIVSMFL